MQPTTVHMYENDSPYTYAMDGAATMTIITIMNVHVARTVTNTNTANTTDTVNNIDMCTHTNITSQTAHMGPIIKTRLKLRVILHIRITRLHTPTHTHNDGYDNTHDKTKTKAG